MEPPHQVGDLREGGVAPQVRGGRAAGQDRPVQERQHLRARRCVQGHRDRRHVDTDGGQVGQPCAHGPALRRTVSPLRVTEWVRKPPVSFSSTGSWCDGVMAYPFVAEPVITGQA
jgi:hypothetical protein